MSEGSTLGAVVFLIYTESRRESNCGGGLGGAATRTAPTGYVGEYIVMCP